MRWAAMTVRRGRVDEALKWSGGVADIEEVYASGTGGGGALR